MGIEYKHVTLPVGPIPKTVGIDAVLSMELNEFAALGWRVSTINRTGSGFTPYSVLLERPLDD